MSGPQGNPTEDNVTIESITAQIDVIHQKTNHLVEGLIEQRDIARAVLKAISDCLEFRPGDTGRVQVIDGKGESFWETMYELKKAHHE